MISWWILAISIQVTFVFGFIMGAMFKNKEEEDEQGRKN